MERLFEGRYECLRTLGSGGMGTVYLARNRALGNLWAIKAIRKTDSSLDLLTEPNILKRLNHPALPRIVDIGEDAQNLYIVEDYIEGVSLDIQLQTVQRFPESLVADWGRQLCEVLAYLHGQNPPIIYRDMKPGNLIVDLQNRVKLIDFGIAREYKETSTLDTSYIGTRGYAAPEQYGIAQTDARTDIYSLGVTLYHLLTGQSPSDPPYQIMPLRQVDKHFTEGMARIVARCTQEDPSRRYQSVELLRRDLDNLDALNLSEKRRKRIARTKTAVRSVLSVGFAVLLVHGIGLVRTEHSDRYAGLLAQGYRQLDSYNYVQAGQLFQQAVKLDSGRSAGYLGTAAALLRQMRYEECIDYLEQNDARFKDEEDRAQLERDKGYCYMQLEDLQRAILHLERAVAQHPQEEWVTDLAVCYARQELFDQAEQLLEKLNGTHSPAANFVRGQILTEQGAYAQAEMLLLPVAQQREDRALQSKAYGVLAEGYGRQEDWEGQCKLLEQAYGELESPYHLQTIELLGACYHKLGKLEQAGEMFQKLLDENYVRAHIYRNLAVVQQELGQLTQAQQTLRESLERFPGDLTGYVQLAYLTAQIEGEKPVAERDYSEVQRCYEQAVIYSQDGAQAAELAPLAGLLEELRQNNWIRE